MAQRPNSGNLKLIIVESPAKIKTISKFLDASFRVVSTVGHIKDLPSKKQGVSFNEKDGTIDLEYTVLDGKATVIRDICKQAQGASEVYLASDPDREGEIIAWHIGQEVEKVIKDKDNIHRIVFNEITKPAIQEAITKKRTIDLARVNAQQARRVLDRWVGYEISPILWKKITKGLSAGRVQSVAVLLVCIRENEIRNFKPEESWSISTTFTFEAGPIQSDLFKINNKAFKLKTEAEALKVVDKISEHSFSIDAINEKERLKKALPPFMTSTLQQEAYNKLGFSVDKTMTIAQRLYEGVPLADKNSPEALITYMRTDSLRISDTALKSAKAFILKTYGEEYYPKKTQVYAKGGAQDAHEAVRPVDITKHPDIVEKYVERDFGRLYRLIWNRFVSSQMAPAKYFQRQVLIAGGPFTFKTTGSTLMFDGCLAVYTSGEESDDEEKNMAIPKGIEVNQSGALGPVDKKQHFTQPPPRYSEASLVKEMEKKGIGRPSTYAATLSTIQKRGYVERINKRFHPTELGETVDSFLVKHLPDIIDVSFTARMEEDLDKIAQGDAERDAILKDFYRKLHNDLKDLREQTAGKTPIITDIKCPQCSKPLAIRFGKGGQFLGCTGFPDCSETSNFTRDEKGEITLVKTEGPVTLDETCPQCSKALVKRVGRYGPFVSCSGYPDCKYIKQDKLDHPCPSCGKEIVKRAWRKGTFWGCSGYPKCRVAAFGEIVEAECPSCKAPFMAEGAAGKRTCPVPTCPSNANRVTKSAKSTSKRSKNPQRLKKKDS